MPSNSGRSPVPHGLGPPYEVIEKGPMDVYLEALPSIDGAEPVELPTFGKHAKATAMDIGDYIYEQEATVSCAPDSRPYRKQTTRNG